MKKILLFLLVSSQIGWSQNTGQNVISLSAIATHTVVGGPFTELSANLQNIGQTNHVAIFTCTAVAGAGGYTLQGSVQGSIDGVTYFDLGPITNTNTVVVLGSVVRFYGYGAYPYIKVKVSLGSAGSTSIGFNVIYQGYSIPVNTLIDSYGTLTQLASSFNDALTTGGAITLLLTPPDALHSTALYGLGVYSDATGTNLNIGCGPYPGLGSMSIIYKVYNLGASRTLLQPPNLRPIAQCPAGQIMAYTLPGTPVVSVSMQYRFEQ